jgi:hypothetical protein
MLIKSMMPATTEMYLKYSKERGRGVNNDKSGGADLSCHKY